MKMIKNKIPISEGKLKGGFKKGLEQLYRINYMPEEVIEGEKLCDKIELAIMLVEGEKQYAYRSLRFTQPVQLFSFLIGIVKAHIYFSKQRKLFTLSNPKLYNYQINKLMEKIREALRN